MEEAVRLFQKVLDENKLHVELTKPIVKYIENGGVIVEAPQLKVSFMTAEQLNPTQPEEPKKQENESN